MLCLTLCHTSNLSIISPLDPMRDEAYMLLQSMRSHLMLQVVTYINGAMQNHITCTCNQSKG